MLFPDIFAVFYLKTQKIIKILVTFNPYSFRIACLSILKSISMQFEKDASGRRKTLKKPLYVNKCNSFFPQRAFLAQRPVSQKGKTRTKRQPSRAKTIFSVVLTYSFQFRIRRHSRRLFFCSLLPPPLFPPLRIAYFPSSSPHPSPAETNRLQNPAAPPMKKE